MTRQWVDLAHLFTVADFQPKSFLQFGLLRVDKCPVFIPDIKYLSEYQCVTYLASFLRKELCNIRWRCDLSRTCLSFIF